ncbi:aldose 1-epimerase family protein [Salipiger mangrovisoli]|uniref:Aldose 1-epimerase family protein n=1 Tax=Salipiger mangrovisoli TaxID=2865933 RepID=A0ABR9XAP0_9RHOB|nr:aldose 1-epimerase family protein [Salipiger mangrovisoli]MBE9640684.1 aldose 1-epimerase family protein [Salipiger mangrovisoli]
MTDPVTLAQDDLTLTVATLGAEMQSFTKSGQELLWQGDPAWWSGRAPILFPIVGPAPEGRIRIGEFEAEMGQHGFARRSAFLLDALDAGSCRHVLTDSAASRTQFPFGFALAITHALEGGRLEVTAEVHNTGDTPLPFCLGFHPAFAWPLPGGEGQPHGVTLADGSEPALARLEGGRLPATRLPSPFTGGRLRLAHAQFEQDAMIFPDGAGAALAYGVENGPRLDFTFDNLPFLALWQKPGAPYLCVEPWHGMHAPAGGTSQLADRPGALCLAPGDRASFGYTVTPHL